VPDILINSDYIHIVCEIYLFLQKGNPRFQVLTLAIVFWDVVSCNLTEIDEHFTGAHRLHTDGGGSKHL
jgi:hypothetical protein